MRRRFASAFKSGIPSDPTTDRVDQDEIDVFFAMHTKATAWKCLDMSWMLIFVPLFQGLAHFYSGGISMADLIRGSAFPICFVWLPSICFYDRLHKLIEDNPLSWGCTVQGIWSCVVIWAATLGTLNMQTELLRHRTFLCLMIPFFSIMSMVGQSPRWLYFGIVCPTYVTAWIYFHIAVDFVQPAAITVVFVHTMLLGCIRISQERTIFQHFKVAQTLERERQLLKAVQAALQGMLFTVFDASCACNINGQLLSCTPQLNQLLAGEKSPLGAHFWEYASSEAEVVRLQGFLEQASQHAVQQAAKIQVSLRCQGLSETGTHLVDGTRHASDSVKSQMQEVSLYAIKLPQGSLQTGDLNSPCGPNSICGASAGNEKPTAISAGQHGVLFVGLQAHVSSVVAEKDGHQSTPEMPESACHMAAESVNAAAGGNESNESSTAFESLRPEFPSTSQSAFFFDDANSLGSRRSESDFSLTESSLACSEVGVRNEESSASASSELVKRSGRTRGRRSVRDVAVTRNVETQTGGLNLRSQGSQTEIHSIEQRARIRPPSMPTGRSTGKSAAAALIPKAPRKVKLNESSPVLPRFALTGSKTIRFIIDEAMLSLNVSGIGCCSWHIGVATFKRMINEMLAQDCDVRFRPFSGWQCRQCYSMNLSSDSEDDDDEDAIEDSEEKDKVLKPICVICGMQQEPPSHSSSCLASREDTASASGWVPDSADETTSAVVLEEE